MVSSLPVFDPLESLFRAIPEERANLARVARQEGLSPQDAFDAVHDALCTYLKGRDEAGWGPDLRATLHVMVRNAARNKRRRHHVVRPHEAIEELEPEDDVVPSETLLACAEEHMRLRACVARLCDSQRAVVTLRMLEEREGEDVADLMGISRAYVDVLLHRAKARLRSCMLEPHEHAGSAKAASQIPPR